METKFGRWLKTRRLFLVRKGNSKVQSFPEVYLYEKRGSALNLSA